MFPQINGELSCTLFSETNGKKIKVFYVLIVALMCEDALNCTVTVTEPRIINTQCNHVLILILNL